VIPLTVTPAPDTLTAVVPVRWVPVRVTGTTLLRRPVLGTIVDNTGTGLLPWNSMAPMSSLFPTAGSGLALPKKSVLGAALPAAEVVGT
jgi:hypothetical protein